MLVPLSHVLSTEDRLLYALLDPSLIAVCPESDTS